jgi:hypothetical protein
MRMWGVSASSRHADDQRRKRIVLAELVRDAFQFKSRRRLAGRRILAGSSDPKVVERVREPIQLKFPDRGGNDGSNAVRVALHGVGLESASEFVVTPSVGMLASELPHEDVPR